jgi:hypothetical protein
MTTALDYSSVDVPVFYRKEMACSVQRGAGQVLRAGRSALHQPHIIARPAPAPGQGINAALASSST